MENNNEKQFTDDELRMLSNGILSLIDNVTKALNLVCDSKSVKVLLASQEKYRELNTKICEMIKED